MIVDVRLCVHMYLLSLSMPPLLLSPELLHLLIALPLLSLLLFAELSLPSLLLWGTHVLINEPPILTNKSELNYQASLTLEHAVPSYTTRWQFQRQCISVAMLTEAVLKRGPAGDRCAEWEVDSQPGRLIHPHRYSAPSPAEKTLHHITQEYLHRLNDSRLSLSPVWRITKMLGNLPVDWS